MNPAQDRYQESHVIGDPSLRQVAEDYVQRYVGQFSYLLQCRERMLAGEELTVSQVRGVLNCMRADPDVTRLPVPVRPDYDDDDDDDGAGARILPFPDRTRSGTREVRHLPPYVDLKTRWHHGFGISQHRLARVVHRIDTRSQVRYFGRATQHAFADRFDVRLRWLCSANVPRGRSGRWNDLNVELLREDDVVRLLRGGCWTHCRGCARMWDARGETR